MFVRTYSITIPCDLYILCGPLPKGWPIIANVSLGAVQRRSSFVRIRAPHKNRIHAYACALRAIHGAPCSSVTNPLLLH